MATQDLGPAIFQDPTNRRTIAEGTLRTSDGKTIFETSDGALSNRVGKLAARTVNQKFDVMTTQLILTWPVTGVSVGSNGGTHTYLVTPASGV